MMIASDHVDGPEIHLPMATFSPYRANHNSNASIAPHWQAW
ncbi:hypothetical protein [Salmonella bongori]|nr:hypothetical protein [Salmonella bongori]